jgi:NADH:ubiquinone oxidoreductase subunit F (NADH-binding)
MGSGGMIVMDQDTCMVDRGPLFCRFSSRMSPAASAIPAAKVSSRCLTFWTRYLQAGEGREGDVELLEELGSMVQKFSLVRAGHLGTQPGADHHSLLQT